jgi:hypothetical protein
MLRRTWLVGFVVFLTFLGMTGPSQAALTPTPILGGSTDQILPDANGSFIGWTQKSKTHPRHYDAFVQPLSGGVPTGSPMNLNTGRSFGWFGGIRPDANRVGRDPRRKSQGEHAAGVSLRPRNRPPRRSPPSRSRQDARPPDRPALVTGARDS